MVLKTRMNKKGVFFMTLVILIITLFVASFTFYTQVEERKSVQKRVETLNSFVFSLEEDLPRQLFISSFRIIFLFEKRIVETGDYVPDVDLWFHEGFFNGTLGGQPEDLMVGVIYPDLVSSLKQKAQKISANITMADPEITISQEDPWNVKATLSLTIFVQDQNNLASWNRTENISVLIPIENFEDPIYVINTGGQDISKINKTIYPFFSSAADLIDHAEKTYYLAHSDAPSFLDRLEGDITAQSPHGIESLAVPKMKSVSDVSIVDHEYFQNTPGQQVPGLPSYFYIDDDHLAIYNITTGPPEGGGEDPPDHFE